jgi:hypothetical protein
MCFAVFIHCVFLFVAGVAGRQLHEPNARVAAAVRRDCQLALVSQNPRRSLSQQNRSLQRKDRASPAESKPQQFVVACCLFVCLFVCLLFVFLF